MKPYYRTVSDVLPKSGWDAHCLIPYFEKADTESIFLIEMYSMKGSLAYLNMSKKEGPLRLKLNGFFYSFISALSIPSGSELSEVSSSDRQEKFVLRNLITLSCLSIRIAAIVLPFLNVRLTGASRMWPLGSPSDCLVSLCEQQQKKKHQAARILGRKWVQGPAPEHTIRHQ